MARTSMPANLDAIRGLACLLLVAFHVVGGPGSGLRLPDGHALHLLMEWLAQVRMPIFAALSGYLFAAKPPPLDGFGAFLRGKLRRLGLPLLAATPAYAGLRFAIYGDFPQVAWLYSSYLHLWFLQASLMLFLVFGAWTAWMRPGTGALISAGLVSAVASGLIPWISVLSIGGALSLAPFFAFGIVARRHPDALRSNDGLIAAGMIAIVLMALEGAALIGWISAAPRSTIAVALCGCAWFALFLRFVPTSGSLAYIGRASFAIFLWHALFGAAARIVAQRMGIEDTLLLAIASFISAVAAPIAMGQLAAGWPLVALLTGAQLTKRRSAVRSPASTRLARTPKESRYKLPAVRASSSAAPVETTDRFRFRDHGRTRVGRWLRRARGRESDPGYGLQHRGAGVDPAPVSDRRELTARCSASPPS